MTIVEFLLARIAEDEAVAESALHLSNGGRWWVDGPAEHSGKHWIYDVGEKFGDRPVADHIARHNPVRVLAEREAKRRIIAEHPIYRGERIQPVDTSGRDFGCETCHRLDALHSDSLIEALGYCGTLLALAAVYADHPDYDETWRP